MSVAAEVVPVSGTGNSKLSQARRNKNDEFYSRLPDIENELRHYKDHFRDKTVFLNCDDPEWSNFWVYFEMNFDFLGLKRLISTHYTGLDSGNTPPSYSLEIVRGAVPGPDGLIHNEVVKTELVGDGDFRSEECVALLKQADIVVTNPPFSLFREYVAQLVEHEKQFLIIGNMNAITYKESWPLIQAGKMWLGATSFNTGLYFMIPEDFTYADTYKFEREMDGKAVARVPGVCWFTNMDHSRRHEEVILFRKYVDDPSKYPRYDNYDAINIDKVKDIPVDYDGVMGVPITFLGKHNPGQFEIVGQASGNTRASADACVLEEVGYTPHPDDRGGCGIVNGKRVYSRILVRKVV